MTAVQSKNIHSRHGQTGTVDQAADVTIKLDEVQVVLLRFNFRGLFLGNVPKGENVLLAELSVVVETELGVHATVHDEQETMAKPLYSYQRTWPSAVSPMGLISI